MFSRKIYFLCLLGMCTSFFSKAQCGTDPTSGTTVISSAGQIVNSYYPGTGNPTQGSSSLVVGTIDARGSATTIAAGDLVFIVQIQGADINSTNTDSYGNGTSGGSASGYLATNLFAGVYEYNTVSSVAGTTINFSYTLANNYFTRNFSGANSIRRYQVIRVQRYFNLTINAASSVTAPAWNGSTGGMVVLDAANTLTNNGSVDVTALGFRGGGGKQLGGATAGNTNGSGGLAAADYRWNSPLTTAANAVGAAKGESFAGTPAYVLAQNAVTTTNAVEGYVNGSFGRGAAANGGGGGNDADVGGNSNNAGGGGGANGGTGGTGGKSWSANSAVGGEPGSVFAQSAISRLVMGGGGGAGTANNSSAANEYQSSGGCGGGIIFIRAKLYAGNGSFIADGGAAPGVIGVGGTGNTDAAGGGGGGGTIVTVTRSTGSTGLATLTASAKGGKGGDMTNYFDHGPGGGGGGGIIYSTGSFASNNVTAGANGLTRTGSVGGLINNAYGATSGNDGFITVIGWTPALINTNNATSPCGVLPVTIANFYGVNKNALVSLFWQVEKSLNFNRFEIEYSNNGTDFTYAAKVDYNRNSDQYNFSQPQQNSAVTYYRLKLINSDGSFTYSNIITIRNTSDAGTMILFPNPAVAKTTIQISSSSTVMTTLNLFDIAGKLIAHHSIQLRNGINFIPVELSKFSAGTYLVKLTDNNGTVLAKERLIVASGK